MDQAIKNFPNQLRFKPIIENKKKLAKKKKFILSGMGGSHLAGDILKIWKPDLDLIIHHNYGLPEVSGSLKNYLIIVSSYSGNTEEAIETFHIALKKKLSIACISVGGQLLELAKKHKKPYIQLPDTGIEPRSALGFSTVALLALMGENKTLLEISKSADSMHVEELQKNGEALAKRVINSVPLIYSSEKNGPIAYNWKIRFNETGKIPAFCNTFPELNHNEVVGFSGGENTKNLTKGFYFLFLKDKKDHPRVTLRMDVLKGIFEEKGFTVEELQLEGKNVWEKIFISLSVADWASFYTSTQYGLDPKRVEIIEKFKETIREKK